MFDAGKSSRKLMQVNIGASNNVANVTIGVSLHLADSHRLLELFQHFTLHYIAIM